MITDEDPLRGLLFYYDLGFSHTLHVLKEGIRRGEEETIQSQLMITKDAPWQDGRCANDYALEYTRPSQGSTHPCF